jgi:hypothetical protein
MLVILPEALSSAHLRCSIVRFLSRCNSPFPSCRHPGIFAFSAVEFSVRLPVSQSPLVLRQNGRMKDEPQRQTLRRHPDEPKLEVGDVVEIKDGVVGVVLARYKPSGERRNEVHYIVELRPEKGKP